MSIHGSCHCGNIKYVLNTNLSVDELRPRACGCSFCRSHGAKTVSDANGQATIDVADPTLLRRYRFGLELADFIICSRCGVYVGAIMDEDGRSWATLNLRASAHHAVQVRPTSYADEEPDARLSRRKSMWTPASLRLGG